MKLKDLLLSLELIKAREYIDVWIIMWYKHNKYLSEDKDFYDYDALCDYFYQNNLYTKRVRGVRITLNDKSENEENRVLIQII